MNGTGSFSVLSSLLVNHHSNTVPYSRSFICHQHYTLYVLTAKHNKPDKSCSSSVTVRMNLSALQWMYLQPDDNFSFLDYETGSQSGSSMHKVNWRYQFPYLHLCDTTVHEVIWTRRNVHNFTFHLPQPVKISNKWFQYLMELKNITITILQWSDWMFSFWNATVYPEVLGLSL